MEPQEKYKPQKKEATMHETSVFIVDDDPQYLHSLGFYLKLDSPCKIYCYASGEECLRNMQLNPRLIILDYYLNSDDPKSLNGLDVLKQVKSLSPDTKVVILSGQETLQVATDSLKLGAYTYIIKDTQAPFTIRNLIEEFCNDVPGH